jgi:hypothetical protein
MSACPKGGGGGVPDAGVNRCQVDLAATGYFKQDGTGASAKVIDSPEQLIGGELAIARTGDVLLQNDVVRVVIDQPGRIMGPLLSGGGIVDADIQRPSGEPGRDAFGRMALFYALGRLSSVKDVEIISDGSNGGPAVVAATGKDVAHDLINLGALVRNVAGLDVDFVVDPNKPLPLRLTTYYVLSPGEARVRMFTAFCNDGETSVLAPILELMDVGAFEMFNPGRCSNSLGGSKLDPNDDCTFAPSTWFGTQGPGVAYGIRSSSLADLNKPVVANALIGYGGVVGMFVEGESLQGVLTWTNPDARTRPGTFNVRPGQWRGYLRDFMIAKDLAGVHAVMLESDGLTTGALSVQANLPGGTPAAGARVSVLTAAGKMIGVMEANASGLATTRLEPGSYKVSGSLEGRLLGPEVTVEVVAGQTAQQTVVLGVGRALTVTVKDSANAAMPAKVTVFCAGGTCPFNAQTYSQHFLFEGFDQGAAAIGYVPVNGQLTVTLPPGEYDVVVSRGPEYSTWPDTWPATGHRVDLRTADATVAATLGRIVDTPGWISADLHVHAIASTDSAVGNSKRAASFLAEGVDVLVSTDHESITDFAPIVRELGADQLMATMIGEEVTTFSHGHFNAFPLTQNTSLANGGPFDHAGGEDGPTLRMPELFSGIKAQFPGSVVQLNHPRSSNGVLTQLKVDTATLASHGDPANFNMEANPAATASDTKLFSDGFDLIESANGPNPSFEVLNDWMTFLSRGTVKTSSGVSDTHKLYRDNGGYARTYAKVSSDSVTAFQPLEFAEAIRKQHAYASNGPIISFTARKLDANMMPVGPAIDMGDTVSVAANDRLELTVDVQGLEWMEINRVEIYSHAMGRESVNGVENAEWPEGRILLKKDLDPATLPAEAVPGTTLRRVHIVEKFVVQPTADTWFVGMARGTTGRSMRPLHGSRPIAWSSAILVDADGSGAYDDFPLKPGQPLQVARPVVKQPYRVPTEHEFAEAIRKLIEHEH